MKLIKILFSMLGIFLGYYLITLGFKSITTEAFLSMFIGVAFIFMSFLLIIDSVRPFDKRK